MKKTLISYSLVGKKNPLEITRKIYGFRDASNHGRYIYERKGILSEIPYKKLSRGSFWINPKHKEKVVKELKKLNLKPKVVDITIET